MRVLLDTNVLSAGMAGTNIGWQTPPAMIWRGWRTGRFELLISDGLLIELNRTLELPWFVERLAPRARADAMSDLLELAEMTELSIQVSGVASHPADDLVLSAAVSGNADYLVTGDAEFRRVGEYQGVKLRTPAEFLREIDARSE
jgi:putative PIN family toxin of toxin-antitoxin system